MIKGTIRKSQTILGNIDKGTGVRYYGDLPDKPQINGVTLEGNKTAMELYLQEPIEMANEHDIDDMFYGV